MSRLVLIRQGSGSPDVLPLEAWHAIYGAKVFSAPGDELAARLEELGVAVTPVPFASHEALRSGSDIPSGRTELRLLAHVHDRTSPGATALAAELARLAAEHDEIVFLVPVADAEVVVKGTLERALQGDVEIEVVIGRAPRGHRLLDLVQTMHRLRSPGGCPWDAEQTHASLAKYLLDETYELLEAIESGSTTHLAEELGDLLLQVVFHAEIASEDRTFDIDDVANGLVTKLVTRHPHVFGDVQVEGASEVVANWEVIKDHEKGRTSILEGVPEALPALAYAQKLLKRGARVSLPPEGLAHETPPHDEEAFGTLLLSIVAAAREAGVDAEAALRRAARTFRDRLARAEAIASERGIALADLSGDDVAKLWEETS